MPRRLTNLDLDLVRTFVAIAGMGNFTRAAQSLRLQQSTVSLQMQRLEDALGQKLMERSPQGVRLTAEGEIFLGYARRMLELNDEVVARVVEPQMRGVVRLGAPEDFATRHLPDVLARFAHAYPAVALEVTCDLTLNLLDKFGKGAFDLALVKRERTGNGGGIRVWREPLVWVMVDRQAIDTDRPLPLVVSPTPCVYRKRAVDALDRARRPWRVAYTCGSLAGSLAAVKAGLGVTVLPKDMVPADLDTIDGAPLPNLKDTEIALLHAPDLSPPAQRLSQHIVRCLG
ncbi:LysR family transcriptional regulator [Rhodopseudomonas thermotolerans]|uniref:LysR family transcriptional regulator n=2 Tax=Rhodopseudomonas TaxID=1073 RepID=A0A336JQN3_9BRAD|nr:MULTISPECIES: LysR substrate-binding domain-containing protein [Rhodopseudomonas]RED37442.1 LysR family transcriptional regulator [Rhodopseudomonas pentothenatexigens]REG03929.1 LysR family transcriptional regulator [Rhodopseudomonas thermotolerans]SSW90409.1 LysR family transcriptional regulator [Rhodopseudomonas pentothenatexigens]